jgi:hypothetical protein
VSAAAADIPGECDGCRTPQGEILCEACVEKLSEDPEPTECDGCNSPAAVCESCARDGIADRVRQWSERLRCSPSPLSRDAQEAIELLIGDLEAGDA